MVYVTFNGPFLFRFHSLA